MYKQVLSEHLLSNDYQQLTQEEVFLRINNTKETLKRIISYNQDTLSQPEKRAEKAKIRLICLADAAEFAGGAAVYHTRGMVTRLGII